VRKKSGSARPLIRNCHTYTCVARKVGAEPCSLGADGCRRGLGYRRLDNAFLALDDPGRAQRLADRFPTLPWPTILEGFARRVNPLLRDLLAHYRYYWATHQAEYATDVLFTTRGALRDVYPRLQWYECDMTRQEDPCAGDPKKAEQAAGADGGYEVPA